MEKEIIIIRKLKKRIKYILILFLCLFNGYIFSQNQPIHEQYIFDFSLENPSFVGLNDATIIKLVHRQQWFGISNPPNTTFALVRHRFKDTNLGLGGYIYSDQNGANARYGMQVSASYHLLLKSNRNKKNILSFGLSFKGNYHILDQSNFEKDIYDPIINYGRTSSWNINANAGILYSTNSFLLGYTADNLIPLVDKISRITLEPKKIMYHNFHIGKIWSFQENHQIRAYLSFKTEFKIQNQIDINLRYYFLHNKAARSKRVRYQDEIWAGINYKQTLDRDNLSPLSIAPIIGYTKNNYSLALLYDFTLSTLRANNFGTVQVMIAFKLSHSPFQNWSDFKVPNFYYDF